MPELRQNADPVPQTETEKVLLPGMPDGMVERSPGCCEAEGVYTFICPECGKEFTAYGNAKRKYCSHVCYIAARFKGGDA